MPSLLQVGGVRLGVLRGVDFIHLLLSALARRQTHNPVVPATEYGQQRLTTSSIFSIFKRACEHFSLPDSEEGPFHVCFSWNERFQAQRLLWKWTVAAVLCLQANLQGLFTLASLLVGLAQGYSPELLNERDVWITRNAILALLNEATFTVAALFQFSFIDTVTFRRLQPDSVCRQFCSFLI